MTDGASRRDWWVTLGLGVTAIAAATSSFDALRELAVAAGWPGPLSIMLPLTVDSYACVATRVWLAASTGSARARQFARWNGAVAILLSVAGNAAYHLTAAHLLAISWPLVLGVGSVPALVLGLVVHLAVLRGQVDPMRPEAIPEPPLPGPQEAPSPIPLPPSRPAVRTKAGPRYPSEDDLMEAARAADAAHWAAHGRAMSRDALRQELHIGGARASALHQRLKDERLQSPAPNS